MRQDAPTQQAQLRALRKLKIAIAHDSYLYQGGAERVLHVLLELFPQADVFIPLIKQPYYKQLSQTHRVTPSPLNRIPLPARYASFLKPWVFHWWRGLRLHEYDLVISSSHSFSSKSVRVNPSSLHVSYIYTPPRYLYQEFNEMNWLKKPWAQRLFGSLLKTWRQQDRESAQQVDLLIASSKTAHYRIKRYYGRHSKIIFPPVTIPRKPTRKRTPRYYLFHSRLVQQKGAELVVRACNKLKKPLVIIGTGPEEKRLKKLALPHIRFAGFVSERQLDRMYQSAQALIFAAQEEDFGIVPVEAMARGVPVIGFASGGVRETVVPQKTGLLFHDYSIESLEKALRQFETLRFSEHTCRAQAQKFSEERFRRELITTLSQTWRKHAAHKRSSAKNSL